MVTKGKWKAWHPWDTLESVTAIIVDVTPQRTDLLANIKWGSNIPIGEQKANAHLIVSAVNACKKLNKEDPQAVADSIEGVFEALKAITTHFRKLDKLYSKDKEMLEAGEQALAKAEGGK